jgi:hypothetical protein
MHDIQMVDVNKDVNKPILLESSKKTCVFFNEIFTTLCTMIYLSDFIGCK